MTDSNVLKAPAATDEALRTMSAAMMGFPSILVAHQLRLFELVGARPRTAAEVAAELGLRARPAETMLDVATAAGFLERHGQRYQLSATGHDYLLPTSPYYWGHYLDYIIANDLYSMGAVREALTAKERTHAGGTEIFEVHEKEAERGRQFARWMHSVSMGPAQAWPKQAGLERAKHLLDIAGGSGAHTIGALTHHPSLTCTVLDRPSVLSVTKEMLARHQLEGRARLQAFDLWSDPFPPADVHFYSQIFHDWNVERCQHLAKKSFEALPSGGRVVIHELMPNPDGTGPFRVVAVNVVLCLLYSGGKQYTVTELKGFLEGAGFVDLRHTQTFSDWGIVSGTKP